MSPKLPELARLGAAMGERRGKLRLSASSAARKAGLVRGTWEQIEAGNRRPYKQTLAAIDDALNWIPGSSQEVMAGGQPSPIEEQTPVEELTRLIQVIEGDPGFADHEKTAMLAIIQARLSRSEPVDDDAVAE